MLEKLRFYSKHSINDLSVNGQRTLFALLCIAAGVAAIVSLQTLGVMIENTLTTSLQETNQGDLRINGTLEDFGLSEEAREKVGEDGLITPSPTFQDYINAEGLRTLSTMIDAWAEGKTDVQITHRGSLPFTTSGITNENTGKVSPFAFPFIVDSTVFPLYGEIVTGEGKSLAEAITSPDQIVVSQKVAEDLGVSMGDVMTIAGSTTEFTVTGILEENGGAVGGDFAVSILGYYFIDFAALESFPNVEEDTAAAIYVRLGNPELVGELNALLLESYPYLNTVSTEDLRESNQTISNGVRDVVSVMGLLSMLIGGIGIINTMQVIVRRRTVEVAVLKTIGLQGNQVTVLFLVEAFIMGIIGSILGILLGLAMVFLIRGVAESITGDLPFRLSSGPIITGLVVGVLVTTVFGFVPTLSAGQVRPSLVLRPTENVIPRTGILRSLLAILVVVVAIVIIAAGFIGVIAAAVVPGAFIAVGILYALLSLVIWLVGRFFPTFGYVDLKVSLRAMLAGRARAASTLLALVIGVFVLSVITLLTGTVLRQFQRIIELDTGGNVIVVGLVSDASTQMRIEEILEASEGVESYSTISTYNVRPIEVIRPDGTITPYEDIRQRVAELGPLNSNAAPPEDDPTAPRTEDLLDLSFNLIDERAIDANLPDLPFYEGRQLGEEDAGMKHIVITRNNFTANAGINVGDQITFAFEDARLAAFGLSQRNPTTDTYEVVGIIDRSSSPAAGGFTSAIYAPIGAFPENVNPNQVSAVAQVDETAIPEVRSALQELPGILVIETRLLNDLINSLVGQFTSFPILVAALSLLVGGIVIANSVALTTLERRREIAVMKAVGLQRERVLSMLLLENGLMGIIGGLIGVGLGLILLIVLLTMSFPGIGVTESIPYLTALGLMLLCIVIAVFAAMLSAWGASGEKPLNVLRYE